MVKPRRFGQEMVLLVKQKRQESPSLLLRLSSIAQVFVIAVVGFFTLVAIVCGHVFVFVFVKPLLTLTSYALSKLSYDEKKAIGRFPSGRNLGSGIFVSYPPSKVDASYQGSLTTTEGGDQFLLRGSRKGQSG